MNVIIIDELDIEITVPNKRIGILVDSRDAPVSGLVVAGEYDGIIIIGIKTDHDYQFGFQLTKSQAVQIAEALLRSSNKEGR